jgi:hypothetical protein
MTAYQDRAQSFSCDLLPPARDEQDQCEQKRYHCAEGRHDGNRR